jgi:hypothetical protein
MGNFEFSNRRRRLFDDFALVATMEVVGVESPRSHR